MLHEGVSETGEEGREMELVKSELASLKKYHAKLTQIQGLKKKVEALITNVSSMLGVSVAEAKEFLAERLAAGDYSR